MLRRIKQILYRSLENKEISYKKLKEISNKNSTVILLDVRSKQEYEEGHLESAINIPVFELENKANNILKDKTKTIIVYCASGSRSRRAKEILEEMGYKDIYNLKNGLNNI